MGLTYSEVEINNPARSDLKALTIRVLADSGSMHLCLPEPIARQLELKELERREVTLATGEKCLVSYAGPVLIRFANRHCFTGAMVMGDEPLLGAIPMEDMDLVILPLTRTLSVNPASPHIATSVAKEAPPPRYSIAPSSAQDQVVPVD